MRRTIRWKGWLFALLACVVFLSADVNAEANIGKYSGGIVLDENANPVRVEDGLMPSKGEVDVLVIMVEFQDIKHDSAHSNEYVENLFFSDSDELLYGGIPASLTKYYENASYGQLKLSGDVYGWYTAEHERSYYGREDLELPGDDVLFQEVVTALDGEIDYSQYDSDDDGYIDGIYLMYAGANEGWGSAFWTYVSDCATEDLVLDGVNLRKFCFFNEYEGSNTLSHETGHLLGLMDYYDYDKGAYGNVFGTSYSLMSGNYGELDELSKILLGWVVPQKVTQDSELSLRPINEYADVAIVYPAGNASSRTFFLVESYSCEKNNFDCFAEPGLRVYRVNTALEADGKGFLYGITDENEINTIEIVLDTFHLQKSLSPYNTPSSYLIEENSAGEAEWKATGITITDFAYQDGKGHCSVTYETIDINKKPTCTISKLFADNRIYVELNFDVEVKLLEEGLVVNAVSEEETILLLLARNSYNLKNLYSYYLYTDVEECSSDTVYTITIPADSFQSTYGAKSEQIVYTMQTSEFPEVTVVQRDSGMIGMESEIMATEDGGVVYFLIKDNSLQKVEVSGNGTKYMKPLLEVGEYPSYDITACRLDNGEYLVHIHDGSEGYLYRIDTADNCTLLAGGLSTGSISLLCALGNNAVIYRCYGGKYFVIGEDDIIGEFTTPHDAGYYYVDKLWEDRYLAMPAYASTYYIVDSNMNIIKELENPGIEYTIFATGNSNGMEIVGMAAPEGDEQNKVYSYSYDKDYNLISETFLFSKSLSFVESFDGGYVIGMEVARPFVDPNGQGVFSGVVGSPVANVTFMDNHYNTLFSYSVDYESGSMGDSIVNVVRLSDGRFAFATYWQIYITEPYKTPKDAVAAFVERMYTVAMGRASDPSGIKYWTDQLLTHQIDGAGISEGFILSEEFAEKNYSDADYLKILYKTFFNREADEGGIAHWTSQLEAGKSRRSVLAGFVNSNEFDELCTSYGIDRGTMSEDEPDEQPEQGGVEQFVERLYTIALERASEPSGLAEWTRRINAGESTPEEVAKFFFLSEEYVEKNTSNDKYIETLYLTFMDRTAEAGGKAYWVEQLNQGVSRETALEGFAQSPEFQEIMERYGF